MAVFVIPSEAISTICDRSRCRTVALRDRDHRSGISRSPSATSISTAFRMAPSFVGASRSRTSRKKPLEVSRGTRGELESLAGSRSLPAGLVRRAEIVLPCAEGLNNKQVAERVHAGRRTVGKWRERFRTQGLTGLYDERRPGRPCSIGDDEITALPRKTLNGEPPGGSTHRSCRSMADATGVSKSTVHRIRTAFHIRPHRQKHFTLSTDPFFAEKVRDIVGLHLDPPENAMVLCVDEKTRTQAPERTRPPLPLGLGYVEGVTHGCIRHGTATLFAAPDIAIGRVFVRCRAQHRHQELPSFLRHIDADMPADLDIHLVVDNCGTRRHAGVKRRLAARPRCHIHFTPTYSSRLGQVEIRFSIITRKAHPPRLLLLGRPAQAEDPPLHRGIQPRGRVRSHGPPPPTPSFGR